tara:strand:- start:131 stop:256 length:126 start_codon:yes stop_codon:yes gene_type:complete
LFPGNFVKQAGWSGPNKDFVEEDRFIFCKALENFIQDTGPP